MPKKSSPRHLSVSWIGLPVMVCAPVMACVIVLGAGLFSTFIAPAFSETQYTANAFLRCSRDEAILKAFALLKNSRGEPSLRRVVSKPIRVIFKDMGTLHKSLKNYDALSWISNQGEQVIFINEKHRNAPPEALAATIAHEAMHDDIFNSMNEEIASWAHEAEIWAEMKARNPELAKIPPGQSALVDRQNRIELEAGNGTLAEFVKSSPGYRGLPETSPGYGAFTAKKP